MVPKGREIYMIIIAVFTGVLVGEISLRDGISVTYMCHSNVHC